MKAQYPHISKDTMYTLCLFIAKLTEVKIIDRHAIRVEGRLIKELSKSMILIGISKKKRPNTSSPVIKYNSFLEVEYLFKRIYVATA